MKLLALSVIFFLLSVVTVKAEGIKAPEQFKGVIESKDEVDCNPQVCFGLMVKVIEGSHKGELVQIVTPKNIDPQTQYYNVGDVVFLQEFSYLGTIEFVIVGPVREGSLAVLLFLFALIAIIVARLQGLGSIVGLIASVFILFGFVSPQILNGANPVLIGYVGAFSILITSILLSHGITRKTLLALGSSLIGLFIISILTIFFMEAIRLTGFGSSEALSIFSQPNHPDLRGILFASILIGGVGVLDDITINQISALEQIYFANRKLKLNELFSRAMEVGKDHVASLVNTLFIAYASASLPVIMLLQSTNSPLSAIINSEQFAEEIVRSVIASMGLILVVPISTLIAAFYILKVKPEIKKETIELGHTH